MAFNINQFKAELVGGGARPTLFQCQITNPINPTADIKIPFLIRAAGIPESILGQYTVPYFGRQIKYAGDRTFADWTVTVINDEDFAIRNSMEEWMNFINSHDSNSRGLPQQYKSTGQVTQYSKDGSPLRTYIFEGMFPISVDGIQLDWSQTDAIEEFNITFQYDLWKVEGNTGNPTT